VLVEGRFPETLGVLSLPRTAGDGDGGCAVADGLDDTASGGGGETDRTADGEGAGVTGDDDPAPEVVGEVEGTAASPGVAVAADGLETTGPVERAAGTARASTSSAPSATSGPSPTARRSGKWSRQLGQNPETGVAT